jgi:hypothetical protein
MSERGYHIFVAYSDPEAGEIGTVYQASNWIHCEPTNQGSSMFVWPGKKGEGFKDGRLRDERAISAVLRDRSFSKITAYRIKGTRHEYRAQMVKDGFLFFRSTPKRRYVGLYGDKRQVRELRAALKWNEIPYPKRVTNAVQLEITPLAPPMETRSDSLEPLHFVRNHAVEVDAA